MLTIEVRTLLEAAFEAAGVDGTLIVQEQPLTSPTRYVAKLDGDDTFSGSGATPAQAIEDYERVIATKGTTVKNPTGDLTVTLAADGASAAIVVK